MENAAPEGRGGHSLFANENKLYVYGGWKNIKRELPELLDNISTQAAILILEF